MKIAVDAMGGDHAPVEIVKGAVEATRRYGLPVTLVGDEEQVRRELGKYETVGLPIEIRHASQVVSMDEHPANAIRRKQDSSVVVAADLVSSQAAQAMVSAGNTGAAMAVAIIRLGRIPGIGRPAIGALLPTMNGKAVILDAGANVDCSVDNLMQFAVMGSEYAECVLKVSKPRIGLLSIGEEPTKGDQLTQAANAQLSTANLNFVGNVEGKDIFRGAADLVVCDGFAGNIVLKVAEGIAELVVETTKREVSRSALAKLGALLMRPALRRAGAKLDYAEYGGAPLLGVNGVCIISHGRSDSRAICNAVRAAADAYENDVVKRISVSLGQRDLVTP